MSVRVERPPKHPTHKTVLAIAKHTLELHWIDFVTKHIIILETVNCIGFLSCIGLCINLLLFGLQYMFCRHYEYVSFTPPTDTKKQ